MILTWEWWDEILNAVKLNNSTESNIFEQIKQELKKQDEGTYKEWENNKFNINHLFTVDTGRSTLLHFATNNSLLDIAKYLMENDADVNLQNLPHENTPLHLAAVGINYVF